MTSTRRKWTRRAALIALASAPLLYFTARKVDELSADPTGEKECPPLSADSAGELSPPVEVKAPPEPLPWAQTGGTINDASCLNRTSIYGVVQVTRLEDIQNALRFAKENNLKVSMAGVRHSMGGQAFARNAVVLDMTGFNQMSLDEPNKVLTVQSGATWHAIQNFLHPKYAVKAMQSTDIFTLGGSISVNAHGMDHQVGAIGRTIRSMRVLLADGSIETLSQTDNPELFNLVVGGYGLFGVIVDVALEVTDNALYATGRRIVDYQAFPEVFNTELVNDKKLGLMYSHLSTGPQSFLREMILYTYEETAVADAEIPALAEVSSTRLRRFVLNFAKLGSLPMRLKWYAEKYVEPRMEACTVVSRNQALAEGEACLVSRNEPMHDSVKYLQNNLKNETDILQEYFIPREQFITFVDGLRQIMTDHAVTLLNASVRVVHREDNFLTYAPADMFSIVLYINQSTDEAGHARMRQVTGELIDLTTRLNGRFFLPYQLHYTPEQLQKAYPQINAFFEAKKRYDPRLILTNTFYEKYSRSFDN